MTSAAEPDQNSTVEATTEPDFSAIVSEIVAEAQRRRDSGEYSNETLERLDAEFDRHAPLSYRRTGIDGAIRAVESAAFINIDVPTGASRKPFELVKQTIKKSTAWYHLHIARQVTTLGIQITRPLRMLADEQADLAARVRSLESASGVTSKIASSLAMGRQHVESSSDVADAIVGAIGSLEGLVCGCGLDATQVNALREQHPASYFVDVVGVADVNELADTRTDRTLDHLVSVADRTLASVVLGGPVTTLTSNSQRLAIASHAVRAAASGARIIVCSVPDAISDVVATDLADGRPWAAETWQAVYEALGCRSVTATTHGVAHLVVASVV